MMADTADYPLAQSLPITQATPIGAHMSVPIRRKDGSVFGMFCCLSPHANKTLNERDLQVLKVFADMAACQLIGGMEAKREHEEKRAAILGVIERKEFNFVYQPIWDFRLPQPAGFEALCRFTAEPYRSPDQWFYEAFEAGCGVLLELAAIEKALEALGALKDDTFLSINAAPLTILSGELAPLLGKVAMKQVVLEVTEHARVDDYPALLKALAPLRAGGVRLAVDDAGAGYASLQHIIQLNPDVIKLDMALTRAVDTDPARRALASALIFFAGETGSIIVAEGIETQSELETLRVLGVPRGQGYFLGRPIDLLGAQQS
jgi:EAL domain-containing protein (putative c-di-GMP-specific phosphodiesterase class I)